MQSENFKICEYSKKISKYMKTENDTWVYIHTAMVD